VLYRGYEEAINALDLPVKRVVDFIGLDKIADALVT